MAILSLPRTVGDLTEQCGSLEGPWDLFSGPSSPPPQRSLCLTPTCCPATACPPPSRAVRVSIVSPGFCAEPGGSLSFFLRSETCATAHEAQVGSPLLPAQLPPPSLHPLQAASCLGPECSPSPPTCMSQPEPRICPQEPPFHSSHDIPISSCVSGHTSPVP